MKSQSGCQILTGWSSDERSANVDSSEMSSSVTTLWSIIKFSVWNPKVVTGWWWNSSIQTRCRQCTIPLLPEDSPSSESSKTKPGRNGEGRGTERLQSNIWTEHFDSGRMKPQLCVISWITVEPRMPPSPFMMVNFLGCNYREKSTVYLKRSGGPTLAPGYLFKM